MAPSVDLKIPPSTSIVSVSIIDTGTIIRGLKASALVEPEILGHDYLVAPCYSFLIQNPTLNRTLVFDLGIKKDWENWPKPLYDSVIASGATPIVPRDVREFLDIHGFDTENIEGVVWSHGHFDHIGDISTFAPSTKLIVGTGSKEHVFPSYPTNPAAPFHEADVAGREVEELDFGTSSLKIGGLAAIDYFGDGSFYLLDAPGHYIGHMCGFARVTSNPDSFILMSGDAIHHGGQLRPHPWHPLPESILPDPFNLTSPQSCPGEIFHSLLRDGKQAPFYLPSQQPHTYHFDVPTMVETIKKLQEIDAHDNILIVPAHDASFLNVAEFFPKTANAFMEKGWGQKTKWSWLADFAKAVGKDDDIPRKLWGDFRPVVTKNG